MNAELYYEKDNVIYKITISNDSFSWTDERGNIMGKNSEDLQSLFYTIVINYSHYAYNSLEYQSEIMGRYKKKFWIEALFHKNDGYRTPIVLNPFRERGNIDINVETELAEQRSIAFFLILNFTTLFVFILIMTLNLLQSNWIKMVYRKKSNMR